MFNTDAELNADYAMRERVSELAGFASDPDYRAFVNETSPLERPAEYHEAYRDAPTVDWTTRGLYVTRLRLVSDPGFPFWDVSYCDGELNGKPVHVALPFGQLPKRGMQRAIVEEAKRAGVFAKGLGILENVSTIN